MSTALTAALIAYEIDERADRKAAAKFQIETERASTLVSLQAGRLEQLLRGAAAFLATAGNVRAAAFHNYVVSVELAERFPGVRAIVDRLARAHGARLTIDSAPGSGTRMQLHFLPERSHVRAARDVARRAAAS